MKGAWSAALAAMCLGAAFAAQPAHACSVCQAGDPIFSGGAAGPRSGGSLSSYFEYQGYRKASGLLAEEPGEAAEEGNEVNRGRQWNALFTWGVTEQFSLSAQIPYKLNEIRERPDEETAETSRLTGLGDVSLTADYMLWQDRPVLPSTWLSLRLFGKAPTGEDSESVDGRVDPHLQVGTGSWDYGVGLGTGYRLEWGSLYGSVLYRVNGQGANNYQYGNVTLANLAVESPLGHLAGAAEADISTVGLELNYRHAARDDFAGSAYRDSGGSIFYLTPSFRVRLPWLIQERAPSLRLSSQLPLGQSGLRGQQHEGVVWSIGLVFPLR